MVLVLSALGVNLIWINRIDSESPTVLADMLLWSKSLIATRLCTNFSLILLGFVSIFRTVHQRHLMIRLCAAVLLPTLALWLISTLLSLLFYPDFGSNTP